MARRGESACAGAPEAGGDRASVGEQAAAHGASTPEPRWLDDDELTTWMTFVAVMMRLPAALDRQLQRDNGLSHFEYLVLAGLSMAPERTLRMSVLAQFADSQLPRLSQVAARLEKRGWLTRRPDPTDGRFTLATLTDPGWDLVVASAPGHVESVRSLVFDRLTAAQVRQLRTVATRVLEGLDPDCNRQDWPGAPRT